MCSPGLYLTGKEKVDLKRGDRLMAYLFSDKRRMDVVICGWNAKYNSPQMNMRRLEKIANPPSRILVEARKLSGEETPMIYTMEEMCVFPSMNGFWERMKPDEPIWVPGGYRIAGLVNTRDGEGRIITVGPGYLKALDKRKPKSGAGDYYQQTFDSHGGKNPRAPLVIRTTIAREFRRLCGTMCEIA